MPAEDSLISVPLGGNAWRIDKDTAGGKISNNGIVNWADSNAEFTFYVRLGQKGAFRLYLHGLVPDGQSKISVSALGAVKNIFMNRNIPSDHLVGEWQVKDTGYVAFKMIGISKTGSVFADIDSVKLEGPAVGNVSYVKSNEGNFFYWGRRGTSVHLRYAMPEKINAEWFYNEVTVPDSNDVLGSYFMAAGFNEGYFGMQVNSATERRILFSVWSPYKTDDPKSIPEDQKITMLRKGDDVHTGEFGNEGAGGQSYLTYNWKAGHTYRFLVHIKPAAQGRTEYTAYFYPPELKKWLLIASFSRPKTNTYLKGPYSFLENFDPEQGVHTRKVMFNNQWVSDADGKWTELTKAQFTTDNTGAKGYRMDYAGGLSDSAFYLKNCGFFSKYTLRGTSFTRPPSAKKPDVDLGKLP